MKGLIDTLRKGEFDEQLYSYSNLPVATRQGPITNMRYGDRAYFRNFSDYPEGHAWQGENVIKVGADEYWSWTGARETLFQVMNIPRALLSIGLLGVWFASSTGCQKDTKTLQNIVNVRAIWVEQCTAYEQSQEFGKGLPEEKVKILEQILNRATDAVVDSEYRRLCMSVVSAERWATNMPYGDLDFDMTLLMTFVKRLASLGRDKDLLTLLSANCPEFVGVLPIEYFLAKEWKKDSILLLLDAYSNSRNEEAKKALASCLGLAFKEIRGKTANDEAFIAACRKWYQENRTRITISDRYVDGSAIRQKDRGDLFLVDR